MVLVTGEEMSGDKSEVRLYIYINQNSSIISFGDKYSQQRLFLIGYAIAMVTYE